jgi:predicted phosphoribosyltransferase
MLGQVREIEELRERTAVFADRQEAGEILAGLLRREPLTDPLVLAIPAGGVPVAAVIAEKLACPLDVAMVSKITLPWDSETGYGAVAFDNSYSLNRALLARLPLAQLEIEEGLARTRQKVQRRLRLFRAEQPLPQLSRRSVLVVDDGLASGYTLQVALAALRRAGAQAILVAVPTGHAAAVTRLSEMVETICCANIRSGRSFAVAAAYRVWGDVSEAAALKLLRAVQARPLPP